MLKQYWIATPGKIGLGVTAYSPEDAEKLLAAEGYLPNRDYFWANAVEGVDASTLDQKHVVPNMGPPSFRGVWFPCRNL